MEAIFREKMSAADQSEAAISAFLASYRNLQSGDSGMVAEDEIESIQELPAYDGLAAVTGGELLRQTVVIKLNGGLGTSMGLARAKSLLPVKDGLTFLDLIARQILHLREQETGLHFLLMNSFSTHKDTVAFLRRYPALGEPEEFTFLQSRVPKIDAERMTPVEWPNDPSLEWCPPGHGDIYASLLGSGKLEALLARGARFAFISNSDNLGATPDTRILQFMEESGAAFLMEVTRRTEADRKGGHIARRRKDGRLLLRESAQCVEEDMDAFQDVSRHRFFNTNNLWLRLDRLREVLARHDGVFPLPLIRNSKTVDPRDGKSPKVLQLETAMGAAIGEFEDAVALEVPRSRFAPVKKTEDLLVLRSDACELREDWTISLAAEREGRPPQVALDSAYKLVDDFDRLVKVTPSLLRARSLTVKGLVRFEAPVQVEGDVVIVNSGREPRPVAAATLRDATVEV